MYHFSAATCCNINFAILVLKATTIKVYKVYTFFCRQLDFSSEPGVANEILENEPKSYTI